MGNNSAFDRRKPGWVHVDIGAARAVLRSVLSVIEDGATHIGVATDHVVQSSRNDLYAGYKTSVGVPATLLSQFPVLEEALEAIGVVVWPMVDYEADDALASAAAKAARDDRVRQVIIIFARRTKISASALGAQELFS